MINRRKISQIILALLALAFIGFTAMSFFALDVQERHIQVSIWSWSAKMAILFGVIATVLMSPLIWWAERRQARRPRFTHSGQTLPRK